MDTMSRASESKLFILASGGLCNRLKPILSGMRVAAESGRELYIHWNEQLSMSELELALHSDVVSESGRIAAKFPGDWKDFFEFDIHRCDVRNCSGRVLTRDSPILQRSYAGDYVVHHIPFFLRFDDEPSLDRMRMDRLSDRTRDIKDKMVEHVARLAPVGPLSKVIQQFCENKRISKRTVGVHLRRHCPLGAALPVEVFIRSIDKALDEAQNVFLATDWDEAQLTLAARYGDRIVSYRGGRWRRDTRKAIFDAVVDLFILAQTGHIVGCGYSTFSEMAWWLGGCSASNEYIHSSGPTS